MKARVPREPDLYPSVLVGGIVVDHQVERQPGGCVRINLAQEGKEFLAPVLPAKTGDNLAVGGIQRGERAGRAVSEIVVGHAFDIAEPHRQHRLGALERLDSAFLAHAQHQRVLRRI